MFERVYKDHRCGGIFVSQHFVYGFQQCKELCWMETRCNFLEFDQTIHSDSDPDYVLGRKCSLYQSCDPRAVRMLHDVESPWLIFRKLSSNKIMYFILLLRRAGLETVYQQNICHHDGQRRANKNTPPHSCVLNFNFRIQCQTNQF